MLVGDVDVELVSAGKDGLAVLGRDGVVDLSAESLVVHEEHVEVLDLSHDHLAVAAGQHVAGSLLRAVADSGHLHGATEAPSDTVIDTLGLSPGLTDTHEAVRLEALEGLRALHNLLLGHLFNSCGHPAPKNIRVKIHEC